MALVVPVTPRSLKDPPPPPEPVRTLVRWNQFLGSIAAGVALPDAMLKHYITRADIEYAVRSDPNERQKWDEARLAALKRNWSALEIEDVFARIAGGLAVKEAVAEIKGVDDTGHQARAFAQLVIQDTEMNERYILALKSRALVVGEEILTIADDDSQDTLETGGKSGTVPNNANVNRAKLRVETRMRLMSGWYPKLFREKNADVQVNVQVNHAARLEEARARRDHRQPSLPPPVSRAQIDDAIDAVIVEETSKADLDTSWLDQ